MTPISQYDGQCSMRRYGRRDATAGPRCGEAVGMVHAIVTAVTDTIMAAADMVAPSTLATTVPCGA